MLQKGFLGESGTWLNCFLLIWIQPFLPWCWWNFLMDACSISCSCLDVAGTCFWWTHVQSAVLTLMLLEPSSDGRMFNQLFLPWCCWNLFLIDACSISYSYFDVDGTFFWWTHVQSVDLALMLMVRSSDGRMLNQLFFLWCWWNLLLMDACSISWSCLDVDGTFFWWTNVQSAVLTLMLLELVFDRRMLNQLFLLWCWWNLLLMDACSISWSCLDGDSTFVWWTHAQSAVLSLVLMEPSDGRMFNQLILPWCWWNLLLMDECSISCSYFDVAGTCFW